MESSAPLVLARELAKPAHEKVDVEKAGDPRDVDEEEELNVDDDNNVKECAKKEDGGDDAGNTVSSFLKFSIQNILQRHVAQAVCSASEAIRLQHAKEGRKRPVEEAVVQNDATGARESPRVSTPVAHVDHPKEEIEEKRARFEHAAFPLW